MNNVANLVISYHNKTYDDIPSEVLMLLMIEQLILACFVTTRVVIRGWVERDDGKVIMQP